jgi:hypothetical protein
VARDGVDRVGGAHERHAESRRDPSDRRRVVDGRRRARRRYAGVDMADTSLYVEGSYRAPGATIDASFALRTGSAYGQLFERVGNPPHPMLVDTGLHALDVEIRRRRSRLFDGVDFNKMPVKSAGLRALQALVDGTEVAVVAVDAKR